MNRVLTAAALVPFALYVILWGPAWLLFGTVLGFACLCFWEFAQITHVPRMAGCALGLVLLLLPPQQWYLALLLATLGILVAALRFADLTRVVPVTATLLLGVVYVFGAWKTALLLHGFSPYWLLFALSVNWVGDTGAFYFGRQFGRHKLASRISPAKSWEGAIAAVVLSMAYGVLLLPRLAPPISLGASALIALLANVAGQLGDLAESAMKRGAGVKDSGDLLPGHGGVLDRLDSSLFTMPVIYALLVWRGRFF